MPAIIKKYHMKILSLLLMILLPFHSMAASDSVAVFYRPEKVVVVVNERGEAARLQSFMNFVDAGLSLQKETSDGSIKISCKRTIEISSCTFSFIPGEIVIIGERFASAQLLLSDLGLESAEDFSLLFESSMGDQFTLNALSGKTIQFFAKKKVLK